MEKRLKPHRQRRIVRLLRKTVTECQKTIQESLPDESVQREECNAGVVSDIHYVRAFAIGALTRLERRAS